MSVPIELRVAEHTFFAASADEAYVGILSAVLSSGQPVQTHQQSGGGAGKPRGSKELLNFQATLTEPQNRIVQNPARPLDIVGAVARFVWMVAGNERLEDIAFYQPKVRSYTDDHLSIPGSNYGKRLFQPRPGVNQIEGVIGRLQEETGSRRGAAVIWSPEDAVRVSQDIPCAFGAFYHVREDRLHSTTVMRSNNAFLLLPFNIFEFGMVAEIVARSVGAELGTHTHFAGSMHVYDGEEGKARGAMEAFAAARLDPADQRMDAMPIDPSPMEQAVEVARLEAKLRHSLGDLIRRDPEVLLGEARSRLHPYWLAFYRVLLVHALAAVERWAEAYSVAEDLPAYYRGSVDRHVRRMRSEAEPEAVPAESQLDLLGNGRVDLAQELSVIRSAFDPTQEEILRQERDLEVICTTLDGESDPISFAEFRELRRRLIEDAPAARLAASSADTDPGTGAEARLRLDPEEVRMELGRVRKGAGRGGEHLSGEARE